MLVLSLFLLFMVRSDLEVLVGQTHDLVKRCQLWGRYRKQWFMDGVIGEQSRHDQRLDDE